MARKREAVAKNRDAMNAIDAEIPVLRQKHATARARVDVAVNEAKKLIRDDVIELYIELLRCANRPTMGWPVASLKDQALQSRAAGCAE